MNKQNLTFSFVKKKRDFRIVLVDLFQRSSNNNKRKQQTNKQ